MRRAVNFSSIFLAIGIFGASENARALVDVSVLGGGSFAIQSITQPAGGTTNLKLGLAAGLLGKIELPLGGWAVTAGILYTEMGSHQYFATSTVTFDFDVKVPYLQIPIMADYWFMDFLGVGAGFYYAFPMGNVTKSGTQTNAIGGIQSPFSSSQSFSAASYRGDDFGVIVRAQSIIPFNKMFFATATVAYEYGLEDVSNDSTITTHNSTFLALIGGGVGF